MSTAVMMAAADAGAQILIGLGSQAEYGACDGPTREDMLSRPETLYGIAKLATCQAWLHTASQRRLRGVWGRIYSLYGPGSDDSWLIPSLLRSFTERKSPKVTACEQVWEFLHAADAAKAIAALIETEKAEGIFNIGSGAPLRLRDAILLMRDLVAPGVEPLFGHVPYRPDQVMHLEADISKITRVTSWRPEISLAQGFADMANTIGRVS
jgi:nucleoside-diphosphate-sugar epimerase